MATWSCPLDRTKDPFQANRHFAVGIGQVATPPSTIQLCYSKNKYAVISGAATENGIGYATARLFAENGATVALLDLERNSPPKKAAFLVKTIGDTSAT